MPEMPMPQDQQQNPEQLISQAMDAVSKLAEMAPEFGEVLSLMEEILSGGKAQPSNAPVEAGAAKVKQAM